MGCKGDLMGLNREIVVRNGEPLMTMETFRGIFHGTLRCQTWLGNTQTKWTW